VLTQDAVRHTTEYTNVPGKLVLTASGVPVNDCAPEKLAVLFAVVQEAGTLNVANWQTVVGTPAVIIVPVGAATLLFTVTVSVVVVGFVQPNALTQVNV